MELKKPLKLPVFFHNDESTKMEDMEVDFTMDNCEEGMMTFYKVDATSSYKDEAGSYGVIHLSGVEYITRTSRKELDQMIEHLNS